MSRISIEQMLDRSTDIVELPDGVPAKLWEYAKAFLHVQRPFLRFFWRDSEHWFDVLLVRDEFDRADAGHVSVRITCTVLPRAVTARELDVLTLVALGLTNGGIAARLGTSARTVSSQLERLLGKLGQRTRSGLAAVAVDAGLLRLPLPGGSPDASGIGIAELELAYRKRLTPNHSPIRAFSAERAPIRLGLIVPEDLGEDSEQMTNGALLAISEIAEQGGIGGRRLEVIQAPVRQFDWGSVRAGLHLLFDAGVDAIITNYVSAEHPGFLDEVAEYGRPFLHTATFDADVARTEAAPFRYGAILQTCASETYYAPGMLRFVTQLESEDLWQAKQRRIVCIEQPSPSMQLMTPAFMESAAEQGWSVATTIVTSAGATDWDGVIQQAAQYEPDVLLVANYLEDDLISFQEALLSTPIPALVYGVYGPSIPSFVQRLGRKADGVIWSTTTGTYDDDLGRLFRARYRSRYGVEPGWSQAGAAYDQVRMLAAAWRSVDTRMVVDVVRYLRRWPHRGVNGVYYFGETSQAPLLYPDMTSDAALSQAHLVYQIQDTAQVLLAPQPFGRIESFRTPPWIS